MKHSIENQTVLNTSEGFIRNMSGGVDSNFIVKDNDLINDKWVGDFPQQGVTAVPYINPVWTDHRIGGGNGVAIDTTDWNAVINKDQITFFIWVLKILI